MSYGNLAAVYGEIQGDGKGERRLASGRAIMAKLVEEHPDWAQWKQDLAWVDAQIAELREAIVKRKAEAM